MRASKVTLPKVMGAGMSRVGFEARLFSSGLGLPQLWEEQIGAWLYPWTIVRTSDGGNRVPQCHLPFGFAFLFLHLSPESIS